MNRQGPGRISWTDYTWNPVLGYPGYYVSPRGDVLSEKRKVPIVMNPISSPDGHLYVFLYRAGAMNKCWVHRLVLETFGRRARDGEECRHLDGNPANNHLSNLAWGTRQENSDDKGRHGTLPRGERSGAHKLTEADVLEIRRRYGTASLRCLAREYGVSHTCIRRAALGIKWGWLHE